MSRTTIDQLFKITTPTPAGRGSSRASADGTDLFRAHLDRASDIPESKQSRVRDDDSPARLENDEPFDTQAERQENSTGQHAEASATTDSPETPETTKETPSVDEAGDEVTLTAAAVVAAAQPTSAEIAATLDQASSEEVVVESSTSENQPQLNGQSAAKAAATEDANTATSTASAIDAEAGSDGDQSQRKGSAKRQASQTASALTETATDAHETKNAKAKAPAVQLTTARSQETNTLEATLEPEATNSSAQRGDRKADLQAFKLAAHATSATTESDLASTTTTTNLGTSETNAATSAPATTPGSEAVAIGQRSLGNVVTGRATNPASPASGREETATPSVDRARFVNRVGGAIRTAQQRDGQIQLRLSPPELGTLRIQIAVSEGVVTAHLEAETAAARTILLDNLPALRERLAEHQIRIEKFDVDVGRDGQQPADNRGAQERQTNSSRAQTTESTTRVKTEESTATDADSAQSTAAGGLDVRI